MGSATKIVALVAAVTAAICWVFVHRAINRGRRSDALFITASFLTGVSFFAWAIGLM
jgi:hypothetical protein